MKTVLCRRGALSAAGDRSIHCGACWRDGDPEPPDVQALARESHTGVTARPGMETKILGSELVWQMDPYAVGRVKHGRSPRYQHNLTGVDVDGQRYSRRATEARPMPMPARILCPHCRHVNVVEN